MIPISYIEIGLSFYKHLLIPTSQCFYKFHHTIMDMIIKFAHDMIHVRYPKHIWITNNQKLNKIR